MVDTSSFSSRPAADVLEKLAFGDAGVLFVAGIRSGIALQSSQSRMNIGSDALAFMVDRHAVPGQNLPVFLHVFQLREYLIHPGTRDLRLNVVLVELLELGHSSGRERFAGEAIVFVSTVTFSTRTALLRDAR